MATELKSYLSAKWTGGSGRKTTLVNPSNEEPVAETSTEGLDLAKAVDFARRVGGPALRAMTFAQRGELLRKLAKAIGDAREELIGLGMINAGNTRSDAKFDIDGASATLMFYAELAATLGETRFILDAEGTSLGRSARLYGQHILVPRHGVAVHINAFNFPAWGLAEKLAVSFLAAVPTITKPATATAWMTNRIVERWIEAGLLPDGAFSLLCGPIGGLLSHLTGQDVVAFTGSSETAARLRSHEALGANSVHLNVEADSLNAAVLGPDVATGSEALNLFLADVIKEVTQKAGQKCTAIRRIYAPRERLDEIRDMLVERLSEVRVGDPANEKTTMGPLASADQLKGVRSGIDRLATESEVATGGSRPVEGIGVQGSKGYFVSPTLLVKREPGPGDGMNRHEVFGPVATLMPYDNAQRLIELIAAGGGGLVSSLYSDDRKFVAEIVTGIAPFHGRLVLGGEKLAGQSVSPGTVLPQLIHGGPGRAGGGEELGGLRGLQLYLNRVALQGDRALIQNLFPPRRAPEA
jgi:oxepin-CoA hydrolase/3-oxo-5,6-dehydrosuberyl-CoA semialdehyde dehydrogenase